MRVFLPWVLVLAGFPCASASAERGQDEAPPQDRIVSLIEAARTGAFPSVQQLADTLLSEGPTGAHRWFQELDGRRPTHGAPDSGDGYRALSESTLHSLEVVTREVPTEIRQRLEGPELSPVARLDAIRVGLEILAQQGSGEDLALACELAAPGDGTAEEAYRPVGQALERAVAQILIEDTAGFREVEALFRGSHPWVQGFLLRGIAETRSFPALHKLPQFLGKAEGLDTFILTQIGNLAQHVSTPLDDTTLMRIRGFLGASSSTERRQAAYALGQLDDYDCLEELITLLTDEVQAVRQSVHWSLGKITAMTFQPEPKRWRLWYDSETRWWADEAPELLATIRQGELPEVVAAINTCGAKRLFRRQLYRELVPMLESPDLVVVRMTCSSLQSLRATEAIPDLVQLLGHADAQVREQAWLGLRQLTGNQDLPAELGAWQKALRLGPPSAR